MEWILCFICLLPIIVLVVMWCDEYTLIGYRESSEYEGSDRYMSMEYLEKL